MASLFRKSIPLLSLFTLTVQAQKFSEQCSSFVFQSNNTRSIASSFFSAGSRVNISTTLQTIDTDTLPAFCRVELKITTNVTANSTATAEVWLPEEWNNRFLAVGNGGFSGGGKISGQYFWPRWWSADTCHSCCRRARSCCCYARLQVNKHDLFIRLIDIISVAGLSTDSGHNADQLDSSWALGNDVRRLVPP